MDLDERKFRILQAIIDDYITTAMPVGSRTISRKQGMGLSSATIRNEMSDLEELGYLASPHTSAGRIPSYRAYRLYVDQIMRVSSLPTSEYAMLRRMFARRMGQMEDVLASATQALSEMTEYTSVMIAPQLRTIRRVQLVPLTETTALMVTVTEQGVHKESVIRIPQGVTAEHLYAVSNLLTEKIAGRDASELPAIMQDIVIDGSTMGRIIVFQVHKKLDERDMSLLMVFTDFLKQVLMYNPKLYNVHSQFIDVTLSRLIEGEKQNQYIHIFKTWLACDMNISETAKRLYMHRNTLLYKLDKIREILGNTLENYESRLLLMLALQILEYEGEEKV